MQSKKIKILIVDDEKDLRESLSSALDHMGFATTMASSAEEAIEKVKNENFSIAILDVRMPGKSGLDALRAIKESDPSVVVLMMTAHGNVADAVDAVKEGAFNYIEKPVKESHLKALVEKANETREAVSDVALSSPTLLLENGQEFVGHSRQMKGVFLLIQRLANVSTSVLIQGENGTGKELVSSAIHQFGPRKEKRFISINCGAIPKQLIESELFGHEKGAFEGANARHIGKFQSSEGGTLFLDEVSELPPSVQVKLLRALQERVFTPVGSQREIKCDVRVIAATNKNLEKMVKEGSFRQDLYYRLNVMPISLPSLRERIEDIPYLASHFLQKFSSLHQKNISDFDPAALELLKKYAWPGNIRELETAMERAVVMEGGEKISSRSLPEQISGVSQEDALNLPLDSTSSNDTSSNLGQVGIDFQSEKEEFERQFIISALRRFRGRINQTVARANIPKNTLLRKIRKYAIKPTEYGSEKTNLTEDL